MDKYLQQLEGKDVVFVGIGKGRSYEGFLSFMNKHGRAASITAVDKQAGPEPLQFLKDYPENSTVFVKNEAIPAREMPVPYISPTQIFFDCLKSVKPVVIGITGTKGKTTTTSLVGAFLHAAGKKVIVAGNIGTSVLHFVDELTSDTILVLELSSHQLADLHDSPHIGAVTNLYEDHLDYYGDLNTYWEAKHAITKFQTADDYFLYNADFPRLREWAETTHAKTLPLDTSQTISMSKTGLIGEHNRLNALLAREVVRLLGVSDEIVQAALDEFQPVKHRLQKVAEIDKRIYIDDAIASQPEAAIAGIKAVTESVAPIGCLLLGGQDRSYDFGPLMAAVAELKIPNLVLFPDSIARMKAALPSGYSPLILETSSMDEAVDWARHHAAENTVVLLCNGAPSYSLWKDFEEKGDLFQAAVLAQ